VSSVRVTSGSEASASSFCGWCSRIQEIGVITSTTDAIAINGRRAREDRPPDADRVAALEPPRPPEPEAAAVVAALRPVVGSAVGAVRLSEALFALVEALDRELVSALDPTLVAPDRLLVRPVGSLVVPAADWVTQDGLPPAAERALVRETSGVDTPSRECESAM
jgi:hypothetical protein